MSAHLRAPRIRQDSVSAAVATACGSDSGPKCVKKPQDREVDSQLLRARRFVAALRGTPGRAAPMARSGASTEPPVSTKPLSYRQ